MLTKPMTQRHRYSGSDTLSLAESADLTTFVVLAVRATGVLEGASEATMEYAAGIIESEFKAFCNGEGDYGDALRAVNSGTKPEGTALALLVATCAEKIVAFRKEALH